MEFDAELSDMCLMFLGLRSLRQEDCHQFEAYKEMKFQETLAERRFQSSSLGV